MGGRGREMREKATAMSRQEVTVDRIGGGATSSQFLCGYEGKTGSRDNSQVSACSNRKAVVSP